MTAREVEAERERDARETVNDALQLTSTRRASRGRSRRSRGDNPHGAARRRLGWGSCSAGA